MPLSTWGGLAQGINEGLRNVALIKGIQDDTAKQEREKTTFNQSQAEYKRLNEPIIPVADLINKIPDLGEEGLEYAHDFVKAQGVDPAGRISLKQKNELLEALAKDPEAQRAVIGFRRKNLMAKDKALKEELEATTLQGYAPDADVQDTLARKQTEAADVARRLEELNLADPVYQSKINASFKEREVKAKEKAAEKVERPVLPGSGAALDAAAIQEKDPVKKAAYEQAAKRAYAEEIKQRSVSKEKGNYAPSDTEKKFNFWKSLYPGLSNAEIEKKVSKEDIPSEARYVIDVTKEAVKNGTPQSEIAQVETDARAQYRRLTQGVTQAPANANTGKPPGQPQDNPAASRLKALGYAQDVKGNWVTPKKVAPRSTVIATPSRNLSLTEIANQKRQEKNQGKSAAGINTGSVLNKALTGADPYQIIRGLDAELKAGMISKVDYDRRRKEALADFVAQNK